MASTDSQPPSYCAYVAGLAEDNVHRRYHDTEYGFPVDSDDELFGRLILEINQAGLSWTTILNKQDNFRKAFDNFQIERISAYGLEDFERLMNNAGIIRNRLKIAAVIHNAQQVNSLQAEFGSFKHWLTMQGSMELNEWVLLFKQTFKFTGGEITREFLVSTGFLPGAHVHDCPILK
ncbi:MAG: DNA-3-methyladenine glycosylase I [Crocinitomicaceae bacterium]|jgi:DNA-3-methyladenine glycosylase I|nr:DNA-3-methyladenine glycosylase I [Crocinitomicaceae bacterium]